MPSPVSVLGCPPSAMKVPWAASKFKATSYYSVHPLILSATHMMFTDQHENWRIDMKFPSRSQTYTCLRSGHTGVLTTILNFKILEILSVLWVIPTPSLHIIFLPQTGKVSFLTASELHFGSPTKTLHSMSGELQKTTHVSVGLLHSKRIQTDTHTSTRSFHTHQIHYNTVIKTRLMTHGPHVAVLRYKIQQNQCQADRCRPNQQIP